jgi:hypothetical protein
MSIENRDVFEQVGNLFYAIAIEQKMKPIETGELKLLISEDWIPRSSQDFPLPEESHYILLTIDALLAENTSAEDAYRGFAKFYSFHENVFTRELRRRILQTATEIVNLFRGDEKVPNKHLASLRELFDIRSDVNA